MIRVVTLLAVVDMGDESKSDGEGGAASSEGEGTVVVETLAFCLPKESFHFEGFLAEAVEAVDEVVGRGGEIGDAGGGVPLPAEHRCVGIANTEAGS
jgi:hypothetical protein